MGYNINDILDVVSESTYNDIYDQILFNIYYEDSDDKESETKKEKFKKFVDNASAKYNNGMNKRSVAVANALVKKPKEDVSEEIQKKYEEKLIKARAAYKIGEIMVSSAILIGPLDLIAKAVVVNGVLKSEDPVDKMVADKLKVLTNKANILKDKAVNLINKNKNKKVTKEEFVQPYENIQLQGLNVAKEMDAMLSKANKDDTVTESALIERFDSYLLKEDGTLVENAYNILEVIIEKTDYNKYNIYPIIDHYLNLEIN